VICANFGLVLLGTHVQDSEVAGRSASEYLEAVLFDVHVGDAAGVFGLDEELAEVEWPHSQLTVVAAGHNISRIALYSSNRGLVAFLYTF